MAIRKYKSLQDYMERTGTSGRALVAKVRAKTGRNISEAMLSYILRGSRRCSVMNAFALQVVTGVDMDVLRKWPKVAKEPKPSGKRHKPITDIPKETVDVV